MDRTELVILSPNVIDLEPTDEALCIRVAVQDIRAFELLYERYGARTYAWAAHVLGPRQAEDLTQEVFAVLWARAGQFNPARGDFSRWFWTLVRHRIFRELRRVGRRRRMESADDISTLLTTAPAEGVDGEEAAVVAAVSRNAMDILEQLPEEQRRVLVMSYFAGPSQCEIAPELPLPLGTVKKRARLGLAKLRRAMAGEAASPAIERSEN